MPVVRFLKSCVFLGQVFLSGLVLFLAALRLVDAGGSPADYHPVFVSLFKLLRVLLKYFPFFRDLALLVDPNLGRAHPDADGDPGDATPRRRTPGDADHALVGTSALTLPPEMSETMVRAKSSRRSRSPPLPRTSSGGSLNGLDHHRAGDALSATCSQCNKPFITGFRSRHYCYVCASSFCKRCGVVRHSHLVTCPVGSKCCCARCAHDQLALHGGDHRDNAPRGANNAPRRLGHQRSASDPIPPALNGGGAPVTTG